jgi:hypothetical protein
MVESEAIVKAKAKANVQVHLDWRVWIGGQEFERTPESIEVLSKRHLWYHCLEVNLGWRELLL